MADNHHNQSIQDLYEGDQSKLYSGVLAHHDDGGIESQTSKRQVKRIWKVFWILLIVTVVEIVAGLYGHNSGMPKWLLSTFFLILTVLKAVYIVRVFMHLGDELRNFLITVLIPMVLFIWFIIAFLADGSFWLHMNENVGFHQP